MILNYSHVCFVTVEVKMKGDVQQERRPKMTKNIFYSDWQPKAI